MMKFGKFKGSDTKLMEATTKRGFAHMLNWLIVHTSMNVEVKSFDTFWEKHGTEYDFEDDFKCPVVIFYVLSDRVQVEVCESGYNYWVGFTKDFYARLEKIDTRDGHRIYCIDFDMDNFFTTVQLPSVLIGEAD